MLARAARESHSHSTPTLRHTLTSNNSPKCAWSGVELNTFLLWLQRAQHSHLTLPAPHRPLLLLVITRFHTHMHHHTATSPPIPVNSRLSSSLQEALQACTSDHTRWSNTTGHLDRACPQNRTPRTDQIRWAQGTPVEALHGPNSMNRVTLKHFGIKEFSFTATPVCGVDQLIHNLPMTTQHSRSTLSDSPAGCKADLARQILCAQHMLEWIGGCLRKLCILGLLRFLLRLSFTTRQSSHLHTPLSTVANAILQPPWSGMACKS